MQPVQIHLNYPIIGNEPKGYWLDYPSIFMKDKKYFVSLPSAFNNNELIELKISSINELFSKERTDEILIEIYQKYIQDQMYILEGSSLQ